MAIQGNRPQNRIILVIGVVLALVAGALAFVGVTRGIGGTSGTTVDVYVATADITPGSSLTPDLFSKTAVPDTVAPADRVTDLTTVTGKTAPITLSARQVLTSSFINAQVGATGGGGIPTSHLPITKGFVAMAIPVKGQTADTSVDQVTVGFYIQPEDHIDILFDAGGAGPNDHLVRYAFQDVRVLRVGGGAPAAGTTTASGTAAPAAAAAPTQPTFYIVELPRNQAEMLTLVVGGRAGNNVGIVKYVLRPFNEYGKGVKDPAQNNQLGYPNPNYEPATGVAVPSTADQGAAAQQISSAFAPHS